MDLNVSSYFQEFKRARVIYCVSIYNGFNYFFKNSKDWSISSCFLRKNLHRYKKNGGGWVESEGPCLLASSCNSSRPNLPFSKLDLIDLLQELGQVSGLDSGLLCRCKESCLNHLSS